jgi:hypothetical protein
MTDDELLADLRAMWEAADPVPPSLADDVLLLLAAEQDDDPELLALLAEGDRLVGLRAEGDEGTRMFAGGGLEVLIRVAATGDGRRRIDGWVAPAARGTARVVVGTRIRTAPVSADGRFELDDLPTGTAVLELTLQGEARAHHLRTAGFPI